MKFQNSSLNGLKVTVGTKSVTHARRHARTHAQKAICHINFFKVGGIKRYTMPLGFSSESSASARNKQLPTCPSQVEFAGGRHGANYF